MQQKIKLPYCKLLFKAYNVEGKIIYFDGLQYYFPSVFQIYKFEVEFFRVLRYIMTF